MNTAARTYTSGAASAAHINDAVHRGAIRLAPVNRRGPMTADPYRLDDGIPTITERHTARPMARMAPRLHLVHRVDTLTDLPADAAGVALGDAALPANFRLAGDPSIHTTDNDEAIGGDTYQAEPVVPVDRWPRTRVWKALVAVYLAAGAALAIYLLGA